MYTCDSCSVKFTLASSLRRHCRESCRGKSVTGESGPITLLTCDNCSTKFTRAYTLQQHRRKRCRGQSATEMEEPPLKLQKMEPSASPSASTSTTMSLNNPQENNLKCQLVDATDDAHEKCNMIKRGGVGETLTLEKLYEPITKPLKALTANKPTTFPYTSTSNKKVLARVGVGKQKCLQTTTPNFSKVASYTATMETTPSSIQEDQSVRNMSVSVDCDMSRSVHEASEYFLSDNDGDGDSSSNSLVNGDVDDDSLSDLSENMSRTGDLSKFHTEKLLKKTNGGNFLCWNTARSTAFTNNATEYVHWSTISELIAHLKLLCSTRMAHSSHDNEISAIIEELRERDVIY